MMGTYHEKIESHARYQDGMTSYYVTIFADSADDIPDPDDHPEWEVGSTCIITNSREIKILNNLRKWV